MRANFRFSEGWGRWGLKDVRWEWVSGLKRLALSSVSLICRDHSVDIGRIPDSPLERLERQKSLANTKTVQGNSMGLPFLLRLVGVYRSQTFSI